MSLSGTLRTMNLADLLQWVAGSQKTGRFAFRQGTVVKEVFVQDGLIVGAASNQRTEMLGHVLVARGKLTEEQLRAGLLARRHEAEFLGQILVRLGFISQDDLLRALAERTEEVVYSIFDWADADFHFEPAAQPGPDVVLISLPVDHVLLRGVHRHDEQERIRNVFPDGRVVLATTDKTPPAEILQHPLARRIIEMLDGRRSIEEISFLLHTSPFPVMKFLYEAHRLGLAKIVSLEGAPLMLVTGEAPDSEVTGLTGPARAEAARERLTKGDPEAALTLLLEGEPSEDPEVTTLLKEAERAFLDRVYAEEFRPDAALALEKPLEAMTGETIRSEEYFLLSRMDGMTSVRDIVEIAPMQEAETVRLLRRLVRRGLAKVV